MDLLVFDAGGTAIKYALMNEKTDFIEKGQRPTPQSFEGFLDTIGSIYDRYKSIIKGIALSLPGRIDSANGYSYMGGMLKYNDDKALVSLLKERCLVPITIENDCKCAALAEAWMGNLSDCTNGIVITLGTAVGGGIIINRKLYKGSHFQAGEVSHIIAADDVGKGDNPLFWWQYGSTKSLVEEVAKAKGIPVNEIDGKKVFEFAEQKDKQTLRTLDDFCRKLVIQLINLHMCFDPERIAIGGGISSQDILFEYIDRNLDKCSKYIPKGFVKPEIVRCRFGNSSNLIGALYCFLSKYGYINDDKG